MSEIISNLSIIHKRINKACAAAGRDPGEVKLLLATKTVPAEKIIQVLRQGESVIGENKVQELKEKYEALRAIPHQAHFIGHLQTNKIKEVLKYATCIQSVDRPDLAEKLQKRLESEEKTIEVFMQVNTSYEESKFGIAPENAVDFAVQLSGLDRLKLCGLMTIGIFSSEPEKVRKCFRLLKNIRTSLLEKGLNVPELSMGMSHDLETAIEEGSTMVRIGTAIFGERIYPDSYYWNEEKQVF